MQILIDPLQAWETKGSNTLLSCTKKWIWNQKVLVRMTLVNFRGKLLLEDSGMTGSLTNLPSNSRYLVCVCLRLAYYGSSSFSSMRAISSSLRSPTTATSICSVIIFWSIIVYYISMEIPSPTTLSPMNKYRSQQSIEDIYFLPKSHYLVSDQGVPPVILNYRTAFNEIKCGILGKKTMNANWQ